MDKEMKISPEGLLHKFSSSTSDLKLWMKYLTTPQVSDALNNIISEKWVIPDVKPLKDEFRIIGRAVTVETSSYDWGTVSKGIDMAKKGEVLFINSDDDNYAIWGELTSKTAQKKGLEATIICGATRDVSAIKNLNYPVFTRSIVPNAGEALAKGKVNVPLKCGEVTVYPQDVIIGDDCGVIVVPDAVFSQVIHKALKIKKNEDAVSNKLNEGLSLSEILNI